MRTLFAIFAFLKRTWYLVTLAAVAVDTYGTGPANEMVAFELALVGCALLGTGQLILENGKDSDEDTHHAASPRCVFPALTLAAVRLGNHSCLGALGTRS